MNNPGTGYFWDWGRAAGVFDQQIAATLGDVTTGPWNVSGGGGMFFELRDNNVPEPETVALFTTALLTLFGLRLLCLIELSRDKWSARLAAGRFFLQSLD